MEHALSLIEKSLAGYATDVAVVYEGKQLTYAALDLLAAGAASTLYESGVRSGQRVALLLGNTPDYLIFDIAIMRIGAVKVPLNPMLSESELSHIVDHSSPVALVANDELAAKVESAATSGNSQLQFISVGVGFYLQNPDSVSTFTSTPSALDSTAVIYYTGGTTGNPKGVVHTHHSVGANLLSHIIEADVRRGEQMLLMTPLSHSAGLFAITGLIMGATLTVLPTFSVQKLIEEVRQGRVSWTFLVPTMIYRLLDEVVDSEDRLAGLETIVYGASPIAPHRLRQALQAIDAGFIQLYGQTECPNFGTTLDKREHQLALEDTSLFDACGKASVLADVRVMIEDRVAQTDEIGEVCLRSSYVMQGYLDDPAATAKTIVDGWLHTGDVGLLDERGYLHLRDRKKDMIISGGMNVYPAEVEAVLARQDGVSQVAVIGIPHETWGESVCAFIVPEGGAALDEEAVLAYARQELGSYKRPKTVEFVEALPLTAVGKLDKKALRKRFWAEGDRQIR
jgi:fatty-acyl-CoA synthase